MADKATKKPVNSNTWMIGVVLIILVLGGTTLYQMKLKKELQTKLEQKQQEPKKEKKSGTDLSGDEETEDKETKSDGKSMV